MNIFLIALTLILVVAIIYIVTVIYAKQYIDDVLRIIEFTISAIVFYFFGKKLHEKELFVKSLVVEKENMLRIVLKELRTLNIALIILGIEILVLNYIFKISIIPIIEIVWIFIALIMLFKFLFMKMK